MSPAVLHFRTFFLFPFSIDQSAVIDDHPEIWQGEENWFAGLDTWVTSHISEEYASAAAKLSSWKRAPETRFDASSPAYRDMVFFHPFVRRAFFDIGTTQTHHEPLVHRYVIQSPPGFRLLYEGEDLAGRSASVEVTDVILHMFGNGIGILTLGVEAHHIPWDQALWINDMLRKIYPASSHQIETARIPSRLTLTLEKTTDAAVESEVLAEERWQNSGLTGLRPRLSSILLTLLHFTHYGHEEFEPVLDERMVVNSFVSLDRTQLPAGYENSEEYEIHFSRLLYVDRDGPGYRYDPSFIRREMNRQVYRRWQNEGTLSGSTSSSSVTCELVQTGREASSGTPPGQAFRMFGTRYYLMALIALFYRATLLDFSRESAQVSRQLLPTFSGQMVHHRDLQFATRLMANYQYFNNYWFFTELTSKDEEFEHFRLLREAYRIDILGAEIGDEINKLAGFLDRLYALRNNDAVNRLAMIEIILGVGCLITGFYGMNLPHLEKIVAIPVISLVSLVATTIGTVASVWFVLYIVASNWGDYRASLMPHRYRTTLSPHSLRALRHEVIEDAPPSGAPE